MFKLFISTLVVAAIGARAEQHTVRFQNNCGYGTPRLIQGSTVLSSGAPYTISGALFGAIAYLQTGNCGFDGVGCTLVETTLRNPPFPGAGSSTDISLIPPLRYSVPSSFQYYNGCDWQGASCAYAGCPSAFYKFDDNHVQVQCQANDVNLFITFC